jgi:PKD repeat protein
LNVGDVAVFTAGRGATTSNIRSATLDFGDGTSVDLGNLSGSTTAAHQYSQGGTYTARLNATDVNGEATTSTVIVIVQEPVTVSLSLSNQGNRHIDATANVIGCTPRTFDWNFGNNAVDQTQSTTNNSASSDYTAGGTKTVTVTVRCNDGRTANTSRQLTLDTNP